ncbi:pitrilysin family protein [Nibribacter koreensis]|uniref:Pitrilysin family protein n=1 Tax=Nibribacter koreensis TaxID=1084519 RepID=A0ABP8FVR9_9BACT
MSLNRTVAPGILDTADIPLLIPEVITTNSGTVIHIAHNTIQPIARVEFVFKAGKWFQPKPAIASLTAKMLLEGTITRTARQIAEMADFYGATLDVSHGFDRSTVTLYCLSKFLGDLIPLVLEVIQAPSFPEYELVLLKQRLNQALSVDKQKNGYLASEAYSVKLYGANHPYATFISEEEINAVTLQEVRAFHALHYHLHDCHIFLTGDISPSAKEQILQAVHHETVPPLKPNQAHKELSSKPVSTSLVRVTTKNTLQAALRVGNEVISPSHQDFPALYFTTHLLGGYFGSRLMKNIREDKGYTYGIYASLSTKEHSSTFTIGTEVKGDKTHETIAEIETELDRLKQEPVTEDEMHTVKKHLSGKFISDEATLFDQVDRYKSTVFLKLAPDHYHALVKSFLDMTPERVSATAAKYISKENLLYVVAGGN